jgi:ATP-dependent Clp protease ATP-binding subunit ClpC
VQLRVSTEINAVLERALSLGVQRGQFYVGVEHVFAALLEDSDALPKLVRERHLNTLYAVMREVNRTAAQQSLSTGSGEVFHTPRCIAVLNQAARIAERRGQGSANAGHLLLALLGDGLSAPSRAMDRLELGRGALLDLLRAELLGNGIETPQAPAPAVAAHAERRLDPAPPRLDGAPATDHAAKGQDGALESLTRDLSELARRGDIQAAVGRQEEISQILQVLTRKTKNNVILVGEAGVGKTQIVEGLAYDMAQGHNGLEGLMPGFRLLELNLASLMAGTQYRGAFEEKILALIEQLKRMTNTVLFIDEVHLIMGAGATGGDAMDMANLLKPVLARGEIRCIGATTLQEYRRFVEKDPALERRFQMLRVEELSEEATLDVLARIRPSLERHHHVRISHRAMQAALALTQRYMPNRRLPDKAIDVLDQACARYRMKVLALRSRPDSMGQTLLPTAENKVTPHDIRKVVSQMTAVPIEEMTAEERLHLKDLERQLKSQLIGQDEAVATCVAAVKKSRVGLSDPNRPEAVLLFLGPSGVGKTQLAKLLALHLFGSSNHLLTFDMSEYLEEHSVSRLLGAPPGYAGCEEEGRLTGAVRNTPFCILLFDEIEKAHPRIFDIFLPVFEEGRLKDSRGREVSFKNSIIIMTSNLGAEWLSRSDNGDTSRRLIDTLRERFRPELINRIDEIVPFYPLLTEDVRSILRLEVNVLRERLKDKKIGVRMYQRAYEYLAQQGYSAEFGARELRRAVDKLVTTPLSDRILAGDFQPGDMVDILMEGSELVFRTGVPHHSQRGAEV